MLGKYPEWEGRWRRESTGDWLDFAPELSTQVNSGSKRSDWLISIRYVVRTTGLRDTRARVIAQAIGLRRESRLSVPSFHSLPTSA